MVRTVSKQPPMVCIRDKTIISGIGYTCPKCGATYCTSCARKILDGGVQCVMCGVGLTEEMKK